ncbi:putative transposase [Draconibacterium orientale]|jgi:putative transposase|uniref:Transposase n=1 Tax=Draconibacterium orientale TaxID=1168034 RepID=X5DDN8_9BACT|nr:transposase [Draconibacterium orientale]AHW60978.1 transposase [Draconibacterium orientale]SET86929.1 putative transposase [Draconibacterium orientale]
MVKKRFKKSEIAQILQENRDGKSIQQIIDEYGISQATFYNWRAKYGKSNSDELLMINKLKEENDRLKRMYADLSLENLILKSKLEKQN